MRRTPDTSEQALTAELSVSAALTVILRQDFAALAQWEPVARSGVDPEGVHQLRVSLRRLRAALAAFRSAVPKAVSQPWRDELRWIANQLGPARDLDVFIDSSLNSIRERLTLPGGDRLAARAAEQRTAAYAAVGALLDSVRYAQFKQDFSHWFEHAAWEQAALSLQARQQLERPLAHYAQKRLMRLQQNVLAAGQDLDRQVPASLHSLRIDCKKLRYAAEFFAPVTLGLEALIQALKELQDVLGALHDVAVMSDVLATLLADEHDRDVIRYAGALIGWRAHQADTWLASFDAHWRIFRRCAKKMASN